MHKVAILVFYLFISLISYAQIYNFQNFSVEDGLTQSEITDICEDKHGNLWLGTLGGGVVRYDGYTFISYKEESGLPNNYVRALYTDNEGNIWIGTESGITIYNGRQFTYLDQEGGPGKSIIRDIVQDRNNHTWIATNDSGLYKLQGKIFIHYTKASGLSHNTVNCLFIEKNNVWIGTDRGACTFANNQFGYITRSDGLVHNIVRGITSDKHGNIWFATYGGITRYNNDSLVNYTVNDGLCSNRLYTVYRDSRDNIWFGSSRGIIRYDGTSFKCYSEAVGLAGNVVLCIAQTSSEELWIGTSGGGVSKFDNERFIHYVQNEKLGRRVYSVIQAINGNMIYGTSKGGLTVFDGEAYSLIKAVNGFTDSEVMSLFYDRDSVLWIGTLDDGIYSFSHRGFRHYASDHGVKGNYITGFTQDMFGSIWASSMDSGLFVLNKDSANFIHINNQNGLSSNSIYTIVADDIGNIWVGTADGGLNKIYFDLKSRQPRFSVFTIVYTMENGLTSNTVRSIIIDTLNRIYLGTAGGGITIYDGIRFYPFGTEQGLHSGNVYGLLFDDHYNLYAGTEGGIDRLTFSDSLTVTEQRHFGRSEGFRGIEIYRNSCFKDNNGDLWFGTVNGITQYNPGKDMPIIQAPKIHITGIRLFFDYIQNTSFVDSMQAWYPVPKRIDLPYNQNNITFEFNGVYLRNPSVVSYRWILEGFSDKWSPLIKQREAIFSNLSAGTYTFKVIACNEYGICSEKPAVFVFNIKSPFWQWWWLRVIVFLVLVGIIWLLVFLRIKNIRLKIRTEQEKLEMEKNIIELEQEAARLQMNPHFIFNSLNSIQGFIATKDAFQAKRYLAKFARLMRLILENAREEFIPIQNEVEMLENYLELEKLSVNNKFDFIIKIDKAIDPESCEIPPMMIQPFVENAIIHGIKKKVGKGHIQVNFKREQDIVLCEIIDDGIGREASQKNIVTGKSKHKSTGISVTKRRLKQFSEQTNTNAGVKIVDLKKDSKALGTKVIISIPFESD